MSAKAIHKGKSLLLPVCVVPGSLRCRPAFPVAEKISNDFTHQAISALINCLQQLAIPFMMCPNTSIEHLPDAIQPSPPEAGASSPGCRANCSALSWPHTTATTAPRREQEVSFLNIKPSATFLIMLTTGRLNPAALSPGCLWKPLIYF